MARMAGGAEPTIGIVGPHDLVERIMLSGLPLTAGPGPAPPPDRGDGVTRRLVTAAYRDEQEAPEKVARLGSSVDACLFASRVPYEFARRSGVLSVPATYIQLSGSALYAAMLRASREGLDIARSSIDIVSQADAEDAFGELGVAAGGVHVREEVSGAALIASFHERLWQQEETAVAFTCLQSVARKLTAAQVPVFPLRPTGSAIRSALRTGSLLAGYRRLENAQLAVVIVEVPTLRDTVRRGSPRQAREELRLTVHRFLVQEAQRIQATVSPLGDHGFLVVATRGSLSQAADGAAGPPFVERARTELGIGLEVGVGGGRTELEAETRARAALGRPATTRLTGQARNRSGQPLVPGPRSAPPGASGRGLDTLVRLSEKLSATGATPVVDAETAGRLLSVTPRTARRLLATLVEEGLAWPLPPSRSPQPGRPRQAYRLVVEKLGPRSGSSR
ncbi:MAG TPA: transcriptional regulator [Streptosporangiaceae bacterium]|nr:transcriptional regulator [Streptosporangiaceae bacterium]